MTYSEATAYLFGLQLFGVKLGLENMRRLCAALGHPEQGLRFVHIAGTNGKGSTAAMLDAVLRAAGYRVGLYTSPHLCEITERVRLGGAPVSEEDFAGAVATVRNRVEALRSEGISVTFFEAMTAVALVLFRQAKVEVVVWETGMGGRLDATNVVDPVCAVITRIDRDHERWLGSTLAQIAREKAGILKLGRPAVVLRSGPEPDGAVEARARELGIAVRWVEGAELGRRHEMAWAGQWVRCGEQEWLTSLLGSHQRENTAVVLATIERLNRVGFSIPEEATREGLAGAYWPGRFQVIRAKPPVVLDGGHNPGAMRRIRETWAEVFGSGPSRLLFGCLVDKVGRELVEIWDEPGREVWLAPVKSGRGAEPEAVAASWRQAKLRIFSSVTEAWEEAAREPHDGGTLCTGSLYLVGEILGCFVVGRDEVRLNG